MKIELEIPDEMVGEKVLWLFANMVPIAVKRPEKGWVIKAEYCSMCGECCSKSHLNNLPCKEDGWCKYLIDHPSEEGKRICSLGANRPYMCAIGTARFEPKCTVKWKYP